MVKLGIIQRFGSEIDTLDDNVLQSLSDPREIQTYESAIEYFIFLSNNVSFLRRLRMLGLILAIIFNGTFISYNFFERPIRDKEIPLNFSKLFIVWSEFLVFSCILAGIMFAKINYFIRKEGKLKYDTIKNLFQTSKAMLILSKMSTFVAISLFSPGNAIQKCILQQEGFFRQHESNVEYLKSNPTSKSCAWFVLCLNPNTYPGRFLLACSLIVLFGGGLYVAVLSFAVKASQLDFVGIEEVSTWNTAQFFAFMGVFYQISATTDTTIARLQSSRKQYFSNVRGKVDSESSKKQIYFEYLLMAALIKEHGLSYAMLFICSINEADMIGASRCTEKPWEVR